MEKLPNKDIERMITFIKHEAEEKVKEIEIRSIQEYNTEKALIITQELDKMEKDLFYNQKQEEIRKFKEESNIINKYNLEYVKKKNEIINEIFSLLEEKIKEEKLTEELIKETVSKIGGEYFVLCKEEDKKIVRKMLGNVEIKKVEEFLGGIILVSKDSKTVIDNSYKSRIESIKKYHSSEIIRNIFSQ
ncbi:V-type proton ATPase subunit E 1 (VMA4) [Vairimorpha necatrix]|uniref:V-type proton ATPase subunit E 1 (VMA4) n=1 Tax=Vairimorpha necatrix TaxID=6039 RepID=A0AAX4JC25_9MICR